MSAEAAIFTRTWQVGSRKVTMTLPRLPTGKPGAVAMEWDGSVPRHMSRDEWHQYRAGRNAAMADLARELGLNIAVVDA